MRIYAIVVCILLAACPAAWGFTYSDCSSFYQSYDSLVIWAHSFASANADLVDLYQFGTSYQGRPLLALRISTTPGVNDPSKPEFLFTGGLHAREAIGSETAYGLARCLVDGYRAGDQAIVANLQQREVWIVPDLNPDGRVTFEAGNNLQRKNQQPYPGQTAASLGVDLNRNFPHRWAEGDLYAGSDTYGGPAPLSSPEDTALWNMLHDGTKFSNLLASIDYHSGDMAVYAPLHNTGDLALTPAVEAKIDSVTAGMSLATGLADQPPTYDIYGGLNDSLTDEFGTYAFRVEVFRGSWTGDYFSYFNPTTAAIRNAVVNSGVDAGLYLLSDEAFTVPEPATLTLLVAGGLALLRRRRMPLLLKPPALQGDLAEKSPRRS